MAYGTWFKVPEYSHFLVSAGRCSAQVWAVEGPGRAATAAAAAAPAGGADPAEAMLPAGPAAGLRSHGEFTVGGTTSPPFVCFFGCVCLCAIWVWLGVVAIAFHGVIIIGAVSFLLAVRLVLVLAAGFQAHLLPVWSAFKAAALLALSSSFFSMLWFAFSSHFCFILNGRLVMSDASLSIGIISLRLCVSL